jgi:hypothetical protein
MRCTCGQADYPHHHSFGGTYPCERPEHCRRCESYDERVWGDRPLPVASRTSFRAARRRGYPKEH